MKTAFARLLRGADIRFVRVVTCSIANVIRGKAAAVAALDDVLLSGREVRA